MEEKLLEVFSEDSNFAVIKPPRRNYPGAVIQGDSLSILAGMARNIARVVTSQNLGGADFRENVVELNNALVGRILHYQEVLKVHDISIPYGAPFTEDDLIDID